jgi:hypothetical protein
LLLVALLASRRSADEVADEVGLAPPEDGLAPPPADR